MKDKALARGDGDTVAVVARVLGLSVRSVQRLVGEGMPGKLGTGEYDVHACAKWYFTREAERRMGGGVDEDRLMDRLRHGVDSRAIRAACDSGRARR